MILTGNGFILERVRKNRQVYNEQLKRGEVVAQSVLTTEHTTITYRTIRYFAKTYEFVLVDNQVITYTVQYNQY